MLLVVDDHEDMRRVLLLMLTFEGYDAIGVSSGQEALAFLRINKPALIILDYDMPDMNGLTMFFEMKKDARLRDIPVIMYSANDGKFKEEALRSGIDAYVVKGSSDWANLAPEIVRFVGVGTPREKLPVTHKPHAKGIG